MCFLSFWKKGIFNQDSVNDGFFFKLTIDNIVPVQKQTRVTHFIITVDSNKSIQRLSRVFLQRPSSHTADKRNRAAAMTVLAHCQTYEIQFCIINLYYTISW